MRHAGGLLGVHLQGQAGYTPPGQTQVCRLAMGLPHAQQFTTARDMSTLGVALMRDFPKEYELFATKSFKFRGKTINGHNNLMYRYNGMDGIKTGYTNASGFNLVSAVEDDGRRVIGVVMGGRSAASRDKVDACCCCSSCVGRSSIAATARCKREYCYNCGC